MKKHFMTHSARILIAAAGLTFGLISCDNKNKDVTLPPISGYNNSDEVAATNLVAYWNFDNNKTEVKSGVDATSSARDSYTAGVKGQSIKLDSGYVFYNSIPALDTLKTFSVSAWVQTNNNGRTNPDDETSPNFTSMVFQTSKPNSTFGNINLGLNTESRPSTNDTLTIHGWYTDPSGGLQDNRNDPFGTPSVGVVKNPSGGWVQIAMTVDNSNPVNFLIYANGESIGAYNQRGNNLFTPLTPSKVIIGGWLNNVPGQPHTSDEFPHAFVGNIDQVRVYNKVLTAAEIKALFDLEKAGR